MISLFLLLSLNMDIFSLFWLSHLVIFDFQSLNLDFLSPKFWLFFLLILILSQNIIFHISQISKLCFFIIILPFLFQNFYHFLSFHKFIFKATCSCSGFINISLRKKPKNFWICYLKLLFQDFCRSLGLFFKIKVVSLQIWIPMQVKRSLK